MFISGQLRLILPAPRHAVPASSRNGSQLRPLLETKGTIPALSPISVQSFLAFAEFTNKTNFYPNHQILMRECVVRSDSGRLVLHHRYKGAVCACHGIFQRSGSISRFS